jgi:hypothetical protein
VERELSEEGARQEERDAAKVLEMAKGEQGERGCILPEHRTLLEFQGQDIKGEIERRRQGFFRPDNTNTSASSETMLRIAICRTSSLSTNEDTSSIFNPIP